MTRPSARLVAWFVCAITVLLLAGAVVLQTLKPSTVSSSQWGTDDLFGGAAFASFLTFPLVGALIVSRVPRHPIGWICLGMGLNWMVVALVGAYAKYGVRTDPGSLPAAVGVAWLDGWLWVPAVGLLVYFILLFPDGRLPSARWRPLEWATVLVVVGGCAATALNPGPLQGFDEITNPIGIGGADGVLGRLALGVALLPLCILAAAGSLLLRFRRARGPERQQLKWLLYSASLLGIGFLTIVLLSSSAGKSTPRWLGLLQDFGLLLFAVPAIGAGIAILRHRLYDIDVVINRTLVYGSVTALLGGSYLGLVLLFQLAFRPVTKGSGLAVALSTLAVAALFRPARNRVQELVDRRFYRRKYDAQRTLEGFAARLREEVDLDAVRTELTGVVRETMQPAHVSLWLKEAR